MPQSAGRGPLSKGVRNLCHELDQGAITVEQFKAKLGRLITQQGYLGGVVFQDVGLALDYWIRMRHKERAAEYWQFADQTDAKIRKAFEHWRRAMSRWQREPSTVLERRVMTLQKGEYDGPKSSMS